MIEQSLPRPLVITGVVILMLDLLLAPILDPWIYDVVRRAFLGFPAGWSQYAFIIVRFSEIGFVAGQWALLPLWRTFASDEVYDPDYLAAMLLGAQMASIGTGLFVRYHDSTVACGLLCVALFVVGFYVLCLVPLYVFRRRTRSIIRELRWEDSHESPRLFQFRILHWMIGTGVLAAWLQIGANSGFMASTLAILSLPILVPAYVASSLLCLSLALLAMSRRVAWTAIACANGLIWPLVFFTALYGCQQLVSESVHLVVMVFSFSGALHAVAFVVLMVARSCGYRLIVMPPPHRDLQDVWAKL